MRICLLASGSKGNAIYLETGETRLLIDAGLSARELTARLASIEVLATDLDAILVSHEHQDHCRGLGPFARRYRLPVFMHGAARQALPLLGPLEGHREFESGATWGFRDLQITAIPLTHDAAAPVGFTVASGAGKVGVVTDLGIATRLVTDRLQGCRALIVEANHDELMLRDGPYPWPLKQRIRSTHGHLSNAAAADLVAGLLWEGLEAVFLAHLSETNNLPELARSCCQTALESQNRCRPELVVGGPARPSRCLEL